MGGNAEATKRVEQFESARQKEDVAQSLDLERKLLEDAKNTFELLTPLEKIDLDRLREDRNRCAHPSLHSIDSPYQPTAELARTHMRHAVEHLLGRPPLQGKEALTSIWGDITSELFPEDDIAATERLKLRISRARETLVRELMVRLIKGLTSPPDRGSHPRFIGASKAVLKLHHAYAEKLLSEKLTLLLMAVEESGLHYVVALLRKVPLLRAHVDPTVYTKVSLFLAKCEDDATLINAGEVDELRPALEKEPLSDQRLVALLLGKAEGNLLEKFVQRFETGTDFSSFKTLRACLRSSAIPLPFSDDQLLRFVRSSHTNKSLR